MRFDYCIFASLFVPARKKVIPQKKCAPFSVQAKRRIAERGIVLLSSGAGALSGNTVLQGQFSAVDALYVRSQTFKTFGYVFVSALDLVYIAYNTVAACA